MAEEILVVRPLHEQFLVAVDDDAAFQQDRGDFRGLQDDEVGEFVDAGFLVEEGTIFPLDRLGVVQGGAQSGLVKRRPDPEGEGAAFLRLWVFRRSEDAVAPEMVRVIALDPLVDPLPQVFVVDRVVVDRDEEVGPLFSARAGRSEREVTVPSPLTTITSAPAFPSTSAMTRVVARLKDSSGLPRALIAPGLRR